ncbi:MAG TPA: DUF1080 domain-containing protein [Candidatus Solibacter sp.]|nr:DUF1080 domain-containing protein [Candidatus Solibacter sp.]
MLRFIMLACAIAAAQAQQPAIRPTETIRLFDGRTLDAFETWQQDHHERDPDRVFSVVDRIDGAPAIRISGQHWGGLLTKSAYRDYKLVVEFRWGAVTWGERGDRARDSGILLHCQGRPGSSQKEFNGPWMRSIEFQMIEGGTGDLLVLSGYGDNGELFRASVKAKVRKDRNGQPVFDPNGTPATFSSGRINWPGRSEDWADRLGFRGANDVERPLGEWNRLEAIIEGGNLTYYVNGKLVNQATEATLTEGRLLFQSEGAEVYFRRIELQPLK